MIRTYVVVPRNAIIGFNRKYNETRMEDGNNTRREKLIKIRFPFGGFPLKVCTLTFPGTWPLWVLFYVVSVFLSEAFLRSTTANIFFSLAFRRKHETQAHMKCFHLIRILTIVHRNQVCNAHANTDVQEKCASERIQNKYRCVALGNCVSAWERKTKLTNWSDK